MAVISVLLVIMIILSTLVISAVDYDGDSLGEEKVRSSERIEAGSVVCDTLRLGSDDKVKVSLDYTNKYYNRVIVKLLDYNENVLYNGTAAGFDEKKEYSGTVTLSLMFPIKYIEEFKYISRRNADTFTVRYDIDRGGNRHEISREISLKFPDGDMNAGFTFLICALIMILAFIFRIYRYKLGKLLIIIILSSFIFSAAYLAGYRFHYATNNEALPNVHRGDVVVSRVIKKDLAHEETDIGKEDVALYESDNGDMIMGICKEKRNDEIIVQLAGKFSEEYEVPMEYIREKMSFNIPYAGYALLFVGDFLRK